MSGPVVATLRRWFDSWYVDPNTAQVDPADARRVEWFRCLPFVLLHLSCLLVLVVGFSFTALWVALALYAVRMFAITAFYHRYFSHRAFKTSRIAQFVFAFLGATATQRGPLWWAGHHRNHHRESDGPDDTHSPTRHGFWWSHCGWFMSRQNFATPLHAVKDFARYPELRFLDRFDVFAPIVLVVALYAFGSLLEAFAPELRTNGPQLVVWGFVVSTLVLAHATFTINSLAHVLGSRRYETKDTSRNNLWLALLTFGEGWHNNHHHHPHSARQGFAWWEIDLTYYGLRALESIGVIRELRPVPAHVYPGVGEAGRTATEP